MPSQAAVAVPLRVVAGAPAVPQISAGYVHTCALKADGTVVCWGENADGQSAVPAGLSAIAEVSGGNVYTCARPVDGSVTCWGANTYGGTSVPAGLNSAVQLSHSVNAHTCARESDGTLACWGWNSDGQATVPSGLTSVVDVSAGGYHTCAVKSDGTVLCWGRNDNGQATPPAGLSSASHVAAGGYHSCALKADGTVVCWGVNNSNQATVPAGLTDVSQIGAGFDHTCALRASGTVVCWGGNGSGQLNVPAGLTSVTQVTSGANHSCALKADGTVVCWGGGSGGPGQAPVPPGLNLLGTPPVVYPTLRACWPADGDAHDGAGTNNGALVNGTAFAPGKFGQAFSFDGVDDDVVIPASAALDVGTGEGLTFAAWIFPKGRTSGSYDGSGPIIEFEDGVHLWSYNQFGHDELTSLYTNVYGSPPSDHSVQVLHGITQNAWNHVALTYSRTSGTIALWINGVSVAAAFGGYFTPQTSTTLHIGVRPEGHFPGGHHTFKGLIDEVQIYDHALDASEISALATATQSLCAPAPPSPSGETATFVVSSVEIEQSREEVYRYSVGPNSTAILNRTITDPSFDKPFDFVQGPRGELFVLNRGLAGRPSAPPGSISRLLDPTRAPVSNGVVTSPFFDRPHGGVMRGNDLFVAQIGSELDPNGNPRRGLLRFTLDAAGNLTFRSAVSAGLVFAASRGIALSPAGDELFVSECCNGNDIKRFRFDANGDPVPVGVISGNGMANPHQLTISPWGELFVANVDNSTVSRFVFDAAGNAIANGQIGGNRMSGSIGVAFSPWGELFVASHYDAIISRFTFDASHAAAPHGTISTPDHLGFIRFITPAPVDPPPPVVAPATVSLGNLTQVYDGSAHAVSVATTPANLAVALTYDDSPVPPIGAGTYNVKATVTAPAYAGSATAVLLVKQATATVTLTMLTGQTYDGTPKHAGVTTVPAGLTVVTAYAKGVAAVSDPTDAGSYIVQATVNDRNYAGLDAGTFVIDKAGQSITFAPVPDHTYGDPPFAVGAVASSGLATTIAASGNCTVAVSTVTITGAGSCALTASQSGGVNYRPAADLTRSVAIARAAPRLAWSTPPDLVYGTALGSAQLNAAAAGVTDGPLDGAFSYTPAAGTVLGVGTRTLQTSFAPVDAPNYTTATKSVSLAVKYNTSVGHRFLEPLSLTRSYNAGQDIPVKFDLFLADGRTPVTTERATIRFAPLSATGVEGAPVSLDDDAAFRFDGSHYLYNLKTPKTAVGMYRISALLTDGSRIAIDVEMK